MGSKLPNRFVVASLAVGLLLGCDGSNPTPRPTGTQSGPVGTASSAPAATDPGATTEGTCGEADTVATTPLRYLDAPPDPSTINAAAQEEDEEDPNEGELPPVPVNPDAVVSVDPNMPRADIPLPGAQGDPLPTDVVAYRLPLTVNVTSQIAEPNIAMSATSALMTWNWGAARSFDRGATARYLDPDEMMLDPNGNVVDGGYCCDQLAQYIPELDLWILVVQSSTPRERHQGGNRIRLWLAHGDEPFDAYVDLRSNSVNVGNDNWFDQPKIGTSDGNLFISLNVFGPKPETVEGQPEQPEPFYAAVVFRLALDALANSSTVDLECMTTPYSGLTPVRQASSIMYIGTHYDTSTLAIWRWPDTDSDPTLYLAADYQDGHLVPYPLTPFERDAQGNLVVVNGHNVHEKFKCNPANSSAPETNWCLRSDSRIATAWKNNSQIGFAWNIGQTPDPDPLKSLPYPSIWVLILDESRITSCDLGGCTVARPHFSSPEAAFQYPGIGPNANGDLGMTFVYGGGTFKPACAAAIRDASTPANHNWDLGTIVTSDREAVFPKSGDYLNVWAGTSPNSWVGGCMTVQSTNGFRWPGSVHFMEFGRRSNSPN